MTDEERKAAIDALTAILKSREGSSLPGMLPPEIDMPVDPNLLEPKNGSGLNNKNITIKDPDNILDQKKQNQQQQRDKADQQNQQSGQSGQSGQNSQQQKGQSGQGKRRTGAGARRPGLG